VMNGVAYHHAGLAPSDRSLIEELYLSEKLPILCCTTTLAVGVTPFPPSHLTLGKLSSPSRHHQEYPDIHQQQFRRN